MPGKYKDVYLTNIPINEKYREVMPRHSKWNKYTNIPANCILNQLS